jgi:hypothetical protein
MRRKVAYSSKLAEGSAAEERGESAATEAAEIKLAGTGATGGSAAGGPGAHPQNLVAPTAAGHAQGAPGGRAIARPIDKIEPGKVDKQVNPVDKKKPNRKTPAKAAKGSNVTTGGERKNLGHFLGKVATNTGRPV